MAVDWWNPQHLPTLLHALLLVVLLVWVLILDPHSKLHRALALFLFLRAYRPSFAYFGLQLLNNPVPGRVDVYVALAIPFALLHLALTYRDRYAAKMGRPPGPNIPARGWLILSAAIFVQLLYFLRHDLLTDPATGMPLAVLHRTSHYSLWEVALAFVFLRDYIRSPSGPCGRALLFATVGFGLYGFYTGLHYSASLLIGAAIDRPLGLELPASYWFVASIVGNLLLIAAMIWSAARRLKRRYSMRLVLPLIGVIPLAAVRTWLQFAPLPPETLFNLYLGIGAIPQLAMPLLLSLAVARHHLLDLDVKVRVGLQGGTIGAFMVALFFMFSEGVPLAVASMLGSYEPFRGWATVVGIVGTAILLVFLQPLNRLAERVATRAVPSGKSHAVTGPEDRRSIYFDQAQLAWLDGVMRAKDRLLLERLRERLRLTAAEAVVLEAEAIKDPGRRKLADVVMGGRRQRGRAEPASSAFVF